ncbi:MAG: hypothetical protein IK062_06185 [Selenomonadaceae bacterium]|nr:hypothetical protein [Selenomonadaceae bacterium]
MSTTPSWAKELVIVNSAKEVVDFERLINCQRCAVAHEARMRSYDVMARPSWGFDDTMLKVSNWLLHLNIRFLTSKNVVGRLLKKW